jgi:hypothetical protein
VEYIFAFADVISLKVAELQTVCVPTVEVTDVYQFFNTSELTAHWNMVNRV